MIQNLPARVASGYQRVRELLLAECTPAGHWVGELSTSALSTATAVMALQQVLRAGDAAAGCPHFERYPVLIADGLRWLVEHQNADGGWGDTTASFTNISTTMLCHAVFHATGTTGQYETPVRRAQEWIDKAGGVPALIRRYGRDKTFSIPILTHCALAGLVDWKSVSPLPFELACVPASFYKWVRLPVVSYALPALIAIGQCRAFHLPSWNPVLRGIRRAAVQPTLRLLTQIQPTSGGFLEATPLTSFVTMSLASIGQVTHPVVQNGLRFLVESVRPDGSWPIDTNLATWVTTLSINALGPDLPPELRPSLLEFLGKQQYRTVHPYTQADPGGWAWTDLTGGVPDADDTPGALLAMRVLREQTACSTPSSPTDSQAPFDWDESERAGVRWLLDLQNADGGWPTFCRGWGALPFDRSAPDLTAHALRALDAHEQGWDTAPVPVDPTESRWRRRIARAQAHGFQYLARTQRQDGSWLPLWFGNQHHPDDENATYGTARVLAAYRTAGRTDCSEFLRGFDWLLRNQNDDGSWSGAKGLPSSIEESALALEIVVSHAPQSTAAQRAIEWLLNQIEGNQVHQQSPIGFYFAKLWYSERLYPLAFATHAMRSAVENCV